MEEAKNPEEPIIKGPEDLVTTLEQTRAGFVAMALEKNMLAVPYVRQATALKTLAEKATTPKDLLNIPDLQKSLLTCSGVSDKALYYFTKDEIDAAIFNLIDKYLEPAGASFVDELVYRYLLIKGDALGGQARNLAGTLGERKLIQAVLATFNIMGINYMWLDSEFGHWYPRPMDESGIEQRINGLCWNKTGNEEDNRIMLFNLKVPVVNKNVDLLVFKAGIKNVVKNQKSLIASYDRYIALGELKGGIDPAGADEHWKTARTALLRINEAFGSIGLSPHKIFIGAAIQSAMAVEIYDQLQSGVLAKAANLTNDAQLADMAAWIVNL